MNLLDIKPLSAEWHEYRAHRISGTSVANILGVGRYGTPYTEWARLTGRAERENVDNPFASFGTVTEGAHAEMFDRETGFAVDREPGLVAHPSIDWLCFTPDGLFEGGLWEAKAPSRYTAGEWQEGVPRRYQVQFHVGLEVCGLDGGYVSALLPPRNVDDAYLHMVNVWTSGGSLVEAFDAAGFKAEPFPVKKNERFATACMEKLQRFWDYHVQSDNPPDVTHSEHDKNALKGTGTDGVPVVIEPYTRSKWIALQELQEEEKALKQRIEAHKNQLTQTLERATWRDTRTTLMRSA